MGYRKSPVERADFYHFQNTVICVAKIYNFLRSWKYNFLQKTRSSQGLLCNKKAKSKEENGFLRKWNTSIYTFAVIWDN